MRPTRKSNKEECNCNQFKLMQSTVYIWKTLKKAIKKNLKPYEEY